jgi:hypothetical protein
MTAERTLITYSSPISPNLPVCMIGPDVAHPWTFCDKPC